nr:hypothetical protein MmNV_24 [Menippe mercenaria nudivirus]
MMNLINISSSNSNTTNINIVHDFLDQYEYERSDSTSYHLQNIDVNIILNSLQRKRLTCESLYDIFSDIDKTLELDEFSTPSDASAIHFPITNLVSYTHFNRFYNQEFSVFDLFNVSHIEEIRKLKTIFKDAFPLLLINTYKFNMVCDFYQAMDIKSTNERVIFKIVVLTLTSVIEDVEAFSDATLTRKDVELTLERLRAPPSLDFCKTWMRMHELSCLIQNMNDNTYILFNYMHDKPPIRIFFEYHSKALVLLRQAVRTDTAISKIP